MLPVYDEKLTKTLYDMGVETTQGLIAKAADPRVEAANLERVNRVNENNAPFLAGCYDAAAKWLNDNPV